VRPARRWYRRQVLDLALRRALEGVRRRLETLSESLRNGTVMDALRRDLSYAVRRLLRAPGFTLVAVLSLALGIGANTAMFSVVNAVLFRAPPFAEPDRLVEVYTSDAGGYPYATFSQPDARDLAEAGLRDGIFEHVLLSETVLARAGEPGEAELVFGEAVSADLFRALGIEPVVGRSFTADEDDAPGENRVAMLGYGLWQQRYGGDAGVVGQEIRLNQTRYTIVGVAPDWYTGSLPAFRTGLFVPVSMADEVAGATSRWDSRGRRSGFVKARLAAGVSADQARAWLTRFADELARLHPETNQGRTMTLLPTTDVAVHPLVDGALMPVAGLLLGVVGLVLLIACTNLAAFLLARGEARRSEVAVRLSLGAGRLALMRQLLVETTLLAVLGGAGGLLLARWTVDLLVSFRPPIPIPLSLDFPLDARVLAYTFGVAVLAGLLFGLLPALESSRTDLAAATRVGGARSGTGRGRLRNGLVVAQLALSVVLLVGSGLFVRSLRSAQRLDPGFYTGPAALLLPQLDMTGLSEAEGRAFYEDLKTRLLARPEVEGVAFTDNLPLGFSVQTTALRVPGTSVTSTRADGLLEVDFTWADGAFFEVLEVPVVRGRAFGDQDVEGGERVAVVSEAFAQRFWPGEEAVGRLVHRGSEDDPVRIVGVARDTRVRSLGEDPRPRLYLAASQQYLDGLQVIVRGRASSADLLRLTRDEALALQPDLVLFDQRTMEEHLAIHLFPPRMAALLLSVFGGLALLLAAVGIWGVVSHAVARRTREVGIRVSLGATGSEVVGLLVGGGMRLVGVGVGVGMMLALGVGVALARFLYGIGAVDPVTLVAIPVLLSVVALAAAWLPARRAARVDPVRALRTE
jgi:predicted permease